VRPVDRQLREVRAAEPSDLGVQVGEQAGGLGLAAPKGKPADDVIISPALVQILAKPGPIEGCKIGVIADAGSGLAGVSKLVKSAAGLGVTALVIAPFGGVLKAVAAASLWTERC
jgi:catalase